MNVCDSGITQHIISYSIVCNVLVKRQSKYILNVWKILDNLF